MEDVEAPISMPAMVAGGAPVPDDVMDLSQRLTILQGKRAEDKARIKELEKFKAHYNQVSWSYAVCTVEPLGNGHVWEPPFCREAVVIYNRACVLHFGGLGGGCALFGGKIAESILDARYDLTTT